MMGLNRRVWLSGLVLVLAAGCSRCGKAAPGAQVQVEDVLPKGAVAVVVVPQVHALGQKLEVLQQLKVAGFAAQLQGFGSGQELVNALIQSVGIDVRSREALQGAGLAPDRGAGGAVMLDGTGFLALPVADEGKVTALFQRLAQARLGATEAAELKAGTLVVHTLAPKGAPARFGWVFTKGYALVGVDEAVNKLSGWAQLGDMDALGKDAQWAKALGRLPAERQLLVYLPPGSPVLRGPVGAVAAAASLSAQGLSVTLDAPWKGDPQALEVLARTAQVAPLLGRLPKDAFLVARFAGDPQKLAPYADELVGPFLSKALGESGVDWKAQLFGNVLPGAVAALSLAPTARMDGVPAFDVRRTNPFRWVHLTGAARAKDAATLPKSLETLAQAGPRFGAKIDKQEKEGQAIYVTTYSAGEGVHFAAQGDTVAFGSPLPRVVAALQAKSEGDGPLPAALKAVLEQRAVAAVVDLHALSAAVRELPSDAWGVGGFAIKATTLRWLDATDDLEAITVGAEAKDGAVQLQLTLSLQGAKK